MDATEMFNRIIDYVRSNALIILKSNTTHSLHSTHRAGDSPIAWINMAPAIANFFVDS